ncbi:MAG: glycosyltransferase, partial [Sulfitobacter sp.]|nr:glycosyltransferase [Sulfitobacter sp.]
ARPTPGTDWITIGEVQREWHASPPSNLTHLGWVQDAARRIAEADLVISSTGNSTCQQVLSARKPWIAVPEWRYFDEQLYKAEALARAGAALHLPHLPSSTHAWRSVLERCRSDHSPARQEALLGHDPAARTAEWLERLIQTLWTPQEKLLHKKEDIPVIANTRKAPRSTSTRKGISVLTIARGREAHLANLVRGLAGQSVRPTELIIGVMQDQRYSNLPHAPFPIRQFLVPEGESLPLAQARSAAAEAAQSERLIFLDVDCIPGPDLVADYVRALDDTGDGLVMGEVLYLPDGATDAGLDFARFDREGVRHCDRAGPPESGQRLCNDYRCFWSLSFAMTRECWDRSGGFDPRYTGYGGEDTDFGRTLDALDIPIWWTKGARVYHQYHPHAMPPVHHLRSVVRNAELFGEKWGHRTMEHWLYAFRLMGLIENGPEGIRILREPGPEDFALCQQQAHMPYAATRRVIDHLQQITGEDRFGADRAAEVARAQEELTRIVAE